MERLEILARSAETPVPPTLMVADQSDGSGPTAKTDTLAKDPSLGGLLFGKLEKIDLPAPVGEFKLFFNTNKLSDLWFVVTWGE